MKRMIQTFGHVMLAVLLSCCANGVSGAAQEPAPQGPEAQTPAQLASKEALKQASGKIASVNSQEKTFVVKKVPPLPLLLAEFMMDWRTSIVSKTGQRLSLEDLKRGEPVKIEYFNRDGKNIARSITLMRGQP